MQQWKTDTGVKPPTWPIRKAAQRDSLPFLLQSRHVGTQTLVQVLPLACLVMISGKTYTLSGPQFPLL